MTKLTASIKARGSDAIAISGRLPTASLVPEAVLEIEAGTAIFELPISALAAPRKGKKRKNLLLLSRKSPSPGITSASINTANGAFSFTLSGIAISPSDNPIRARVTVGATEACGLFLISAKGRKASKLSRARSAKVARGKKVKGVQSFVSSGKPLSCYGGSFVINADTKTVLPRSTTIVTFKITADDRVTGPFSLFRLSPRGKATGSPLCTLTDDGQGGDFVADDALFSCRASIVAPASGSVQLIAKSADGSAQQTITLGVSAPLSDEALEALLDANDQVTAIKETALSKFGLSQEARFEIVQELRKDRAIRDVGIASNGVDIYYVYSSGIRGVIPMGLRDRAPRITVARGPSSFVRRSARSTSQLESSARAFIWDPGFFRESEGQAIATLLSLSDEPTFVSDSYVGGSDATIENLKLMSGAGTIILTTHGSMGADDEIVIISGEIRTPRNVAKYREDFDAGRVVIVEPNLLGVGASWVDKHVSFSPGSIMYAGFCYSNANDSLSSAFRSKGVSSYFGFTDAVSSKFAYNAATTAFCSLLLERDTTLTAFSKVEPKIDPFDDRLASFVLKGSEEVVYPGSRDLEFRLSTRNIRYFAAAPDTVFDIEAMVGQGQNLPCVDFSWRTEGDVGTLVTSSGERTNEVDGPDSKVRYQFLPGEIFGTDTVELQVLRRANGEVVRGEEITIEPYCPVETQPGLETQPASAKIGDDEKITVKISAPGAEMCAFEYEWSMKDPHPCISMSDGTQTGATIRTSSDSVTFETLNCFDFNRDPIKQTYAVKLFSPADESDPSYDLNFQLTSAFDVEQKCTRPKQGGGIEELCCYDEMDNDEDGDADCSDSDCQLDPACASNLTIKGTTYETANGTRLVAGAFAVITPESNATSETLYCVKIAPNGPAAPNGRFANTSPFIVEHEAFDPCGGQCGDWLDGKKAVVTLEGYAGFAIDTNNPYCGKPQPDVNIPRCDLGLLVDYLDQYYASYTYQARAKGSAASCEELFQ